MDPEQLLYRQLKVNFKAYWWSLQVYGEMHVLKLCSDHNNSAYYMIISLLDEPTL